MSKFSGKICTAYCTCVYRRVQMYTSIRDEYVSYFVAANTALGTGMRRLDLPQQCDGRDAFSAEKERCVCVCGCWRSAASCHHTEAWFFRKHCLILRHRGTQCIVRIITNTATARDGSDLTCLFVPRLNPKL